MTPEVVTSDVTVTAMKGPRGNAMAEHVAMFILALARRLQGAVRDHAQRRWDSEAGTNLANPYLELRGKTALVMDVGSIGSAVARICNGGFQMRALGLSPTTSGDPHVDRYIDRSGLHAALAEADFVCLTVALATETEGIMDADAIAAMKPTAYLINVARGSVVDEAALADASRDGRHRRRRPRRVDGAATTPGQSILGPAIRDPYTPSSSLTNRFMSDSLDFYAENIRRFGDGEPLMGMVDKDVGY